MAELQNPAPALARYLYILFFVTVGILGLAEWLFLRGQSPQAKKRWYPRLTAGNSAVILLLMSAIVLAWGDGPGPIIFLLVFGGLITYLSVTRTRVCDACGRLSQPQNLITAPDFCPKCGARLAPDPWVKRWWLNEPGTSLTE